MNLAELKYCVDLAINNLHSYEKPEDISALITLSEPSIGARACSDIRYVGMGFDWEHGQFRIHPDKQLVRMGKSLTDVIPAHQYISETGSRKSYICNTCGGQVGKEDRFCKHCGQKLRQINFL